MSFFTAYKPPIRQEGFHLPSPPPSNDTTTPPPTYDLFNVDYKPPQFNDELANLMSNERYDEYQHHHAQQQQQQQQQQRHTHNIFDISAPAIHPHPASYPSQPSSYHHPTPSTHFNSTLPALGSVRYEPERSRSRSRPPSGEGPGPGPLRTAKRRGGSVSSTSPPPVKPGAIVIPGQRGQQQQQVGSPMSPGGTWFGSGSTSTPTTEYLPTPDSLHSHSLQQHNSSHQGYTPFSLPSPGDMHLPPLHNHNHNHGHGHHHKEMLHRDIMSGPRDIMSSTAPRDILHPHAPPSNSYSISPPLSSSLTGALSSLGQMSPLSPVHTNGGGATMTTQDKQAMLANEKRRRRRESHNAVERRRRDNINEKISELATLIPECMLEGGTSTSPAPLPLDPDTLVPTSPTSAPPPPSATEKEKKDEEDPGVVKANKGMILRKSVEYIRYLQQLVTAQGARNRELERELKAYRGGSPEEGGKEHEQEGEGEFFELGDEFGYGGRLESMPEEDGGEDQDMESPEGEEGDGEGERGRTRVMRRVKEEEGMVV